MRTLRTGILLAAAVLMVALSARAFQAQREFDHDQNAQNVQIATNTQHLSDLDRRVTTLEALKMGEQISRLEATIATNQTWLMVISTGILALILERTAWLLFGRAGDASWRKKRLDANDA